MNRRVSVAMATYNGALHIRAQLESIAAQSRLPDQLIVSDDGSTDETYFILSEFARTAPFQVRVLRNEVNLGYCANFNVALRETDGDLVFLSDQDDVWFPNKIEHMISVAERYPNALMLMNDAVLTDGALRDSGLTKLGQIGSAGLDLSSFVMGCCSLIRRELLDMSLPIPAGFNAHDGWLAWFADGVGAKHVERDVLQYYRRHENNESQFVANTLSRVTRLGALTHSVRRTLFDKKFREKVESQVEQVEMFAAGVRRAITRSPRVYGEDLAQLLAATEVRLSILRRRREIRKMAFVPKMMAAWSLLQRGGYQQASGIKSFFRDLLV